ncbi:DEAD/DEAH box helicase [Homoserinibacter sp. YIM 151385]|uniref:DEAD/DEAH box helicase n=1 Tax=Homoserinibacter sp. YIM 151385 TaxID=2985506 RepID=UPI0022F03027|nr:DEAD/DEAH box helicase [Homoserinibacter sp. YIM 151385]WBU38564.1 DEAD/DEAH box helicase [Homoserinibacter sp. YIM 151385]
MSSPDPTAHPHGSAAAEQLSPSFPDRAAWGTVSKLRAWQEEAIEAYFREQPRDFLVSATPGAGKTTFALRLASILLQNDIVDRVTVVAPTEHLKVQWADAAHRAGIRLDPRFTNRHGQEARHYQGVVVTYAQVAVRASVHRRLTESARSLVILDEVHHGGDALSWGDAVREAFEPAVRRLSLSGTPFRSDTAPIPFVRYERDRRGIRLSQADYSYGYGHALKDGVVRPVMFLSYAGSMRWRTRQGEEMEATLGQGDTKDVTSQAWRAALDPEGEWVSAVLRAADRRLSEVRQSIPDAGGLVIATDQTVARAYADILAQITGRRPVVVLSDEAEASARIDAFSTSDERWMVAVRMVSEGVDVPRLCVGVYATSASTPLFFAQAIGRFVRARRRGETASVFLPSVPVLLGLAAELERERDHALDRESSGEDGLLDDSMLDAANREEQASDALVDEFEWKALGSVATFEKVVYDGHEFGQLAEPGTDEEWDFIGLPGILEPEQVSDLLRQRQSRQSRRAEERRRRDPGAVDVAEQSSPAALHRTLSEQRKLLNSLVSIEARGSGRTHGQVHAEVRRVCGGPEVARATVTQLQARIDHLRRGLHGH